MQATANPVRKYVAHGLACALILVWFRTPYLVFEASLKLATWFGEEPSGSEKFDGWRLMAAALVTGLVAPLAAAWLGRRSKVLKVVALVEAGFVAGLLMIDLGATVVERL